MRLFLVAVLLASAVPVSAKNSSDSKSLRKACEYLWSKQADDGGWHSEQYAVLRSGQSLTPFVLHALLGSVGDMSSDETGRVVRAIEFIRKHADKDGAIGRADPELLEYPVYSTAYSVLSLKRIQNYRHLRREANDRLIARMEAYLARAQFEDDDGFTMKDAAFGGWGFDLASRPGEPGHMDLAHTRRALAALRTPPDAFSRDHQKSADRTSVYKLAAKFLKLVQKHPDAADRQPFIEGFSPSTAKTPFDGGFYFSPVVLSANKGREEFKGAKYFRSYATATCDGILALLACGVNRDDDRVVRAVQWLTDHDDLTYPEGVPTDHPEPWGEAIRFYHYSVRAEVYAALNWPGPWRAKLAAAVAEQQAADGSFRNTASPLMKEDDPVLCTTLATIALTHCRCGISGQ